jgi:hypothetical protein
LKNCVPASDCRTSLDVKSSASCCQACAGDDTDRAALEAISCGQANTAGSPGVVAVTACDHD